MEYSSNYSDYLGGYFDLFLCSISGGYYSFYCSPFMKKDEIKLSCNNNDHRAAMLPTLIKFFRQETGNFFFVFSFFSRVGEFHFKLVHKRKNLIKASF